MCYTLLHQLNETDAIITPVLWISKWELTKIGLKNTMLIRWWRWDLKPGQHYFSLLKQFFNPFVFVVNISRTPLSREISSRTPYKIDKSRTDLTGTKWKSWSPATLSSYLAFSFHLAPEIPLFENLCPTSYYPSHETDTLFAGICLPPPPNPSELGFFKNLDHNPPN